MKGRRGWFGNSGGHSLAARGVRLYARKDHYVDPLFYARKREQALPFVSIMDMVRRGMTYDQMKRAHPGVDAEDLRLRGIKAVEVVDGTDTLSKLNADGVDMSVKVAQESNVRRQRMLSCLADPQKVSFLPSAKVEFLRERLKA